MFKIVRDPFMMAFSKTHGRKYWFNTQTRASLFDCPREAVVDFKTAFCKRSNIEDSFLCSVAGNMSLSETIFNQGRNQSSYLLF